MKYIFYVALLSVALPVFLFAGTGTAPSDRPSIDLAGHSQNDNRGRRRGRGRDDSNRSNSNSSNSNRSGSAISWPDARAAALRAVPGTIVKEELEQKYGRSIFEFYIRNQGGETFEVYVDAENGDIVKIERKSRR